MSTFGNVSLYNDYIGYSRKYFQSLVGVNFLYQYVLIFQTENVYVNSNHYKRSNKKKKLYYQQGQLLMKLIISEELNDIILNITSNRSQNTNVYCNNCNYGVLMLIHEI